MVHRQRIVLGALALLVLAVIGWLLLRDASPAPDPGAPVAAAELASHAAAAPAAAATPQATEPADRRPVAVETEATTAAAEPGPEKLWGRVISADGGTPITGAEVQLQWTDADQFWNLDLEHGRDVDVLARARSDADGRFRFGVARAHKHRLHASAPAFAPATVVGCTGGSQVTIELSRGARLDGVVRCGGKALVDVAVRIAVSGQRVELANGRTDGRGAFVFSGLPPATVFVQVRSPLHQELWQRLVLTPGGDHHLEIEVAPGASLRGGIVEASTRAPIAAAEITDSWTFERVVRSDAEGRFEMQGLRDDGFVEVHVRARGYAAASRNVAGQLDREAVFELVRGGEVTGRIVGADGKPLATVYAAVGASYMEGPGMGSTDWIRARVFADGRFLATGLRPDQHYWLYVRSRGHGSRVHALPRPLLSGEAFDLGDVVMRPAGGVEGRVIDEAGAPWIGISVSVDGANADSRSALSDSKDPTQVSQFTSRFCTTDACGCFRCTDLAGGSYRFRASIRGYESTPSVEVEVADGEIRAGVELVVARGLSIEGVLRYADGRLLGDEAAQLRLTAAKESGEGSSAQIETGGRFRLSGLEDAAYTVSLLRGPEGWSLSPRAGVPAGTKDLQLVLQPSAFVSGRVVDEDGKGVRARVWAFPEGNRYGSASYATDDEGRFRIEVPLDFHGSIRAADPQNWVLQTRVEGVSAGRADLELKLRR